MIRGLGVRGSDNTPAFAKGIPAASVGSKGPCLAYHLSGDTMTRITPEIMADIAPGPFLASFSRADRR